MGNSSGENTTKVYVVDNTAPDISIINNVSIPYQDAVGNNLYTVDNTVTVEITDMVSGIREIGYAKISENNSFPGYGRSGTCHSAGDPADEQDMEAPGGSSSGAARFTGHPLKCREDPNQSHVDRNLCVEAAGIWR